MAELTSVSASAGRTPLGIERAAERARAEQLAERTLERPARRGEDRVEISRAAQRPATDAADLRRDLIARIRGEIADGTYETPERIDGAIDAILGGQVLDLTA